MVIGSETIGASQTTWEIIFPKLLSLAEKILNKYFVSKKETLVFNHYPVYTLYICFTNTTCKFFHRQMYSKQQTRLTPVLFCVSVGGLGIDHFLNSFLGEMAKYKGLPFLLQDILDSLLMTVNVVHVNETYTSISFEVSRLSRDCYIKLLCSNINTKEMCHTWIVLS